MPKVIVGGLKWVEKEMEVSGDFLPIIVKANSDDDNFTKEELEKIWKIQSEGAYWLGAPECSYIGTIDGETIVDY